MPNPTPLFDLIAFDADDTLWHNESIYEQTQDKFRQLLAPYASPQEIDAALYRTEMDNLPYFGYGIKSFCLSMIETAARLSGGRIAASELAGIAGYAKAMIDAGVELLDGVRETVAQLAETYPLMLITKGDLLDQERKLGISGLLAYFRYVEIVSDKTRERYNALLERYRIDPGRFLMVGNSLRSDIQPAVAAGSRAVYIPYALTWEHEKQVDPHLESGGYWELEHIRQLPELLERLAGA